MLFGICLFVVYTYFCWFVVRGLFGLTCLTFGLGFILVLVWCVVLVWWFVVFADFDVCADCGLDYWCCLIRLGLLGVIVLLLLERDCWVFWIIWFIWNCVGLDCFEYCLFDGWICFGLLVVWLYVLF